MTAIHRETVATSDPCAHRAAIAAMGTTLGPATLTAVHGLFADEQNAYAAEQPAALIDQAYGPDPRGRCGNRHAASHRQSRPVKSSQR